MPLPRSLLMTHTRPSFRLLGGAALAALFVAAGLLAPPPGTASSHREAPLIADDPLADNTDVYAFRDPARTEEVIIVANYVPLTHPEGGPNWHHFGENVRYEIHVKNETDAGPLGSATDDVTYRFTFSRTNEDPSTFFLIRAGAENLKTTYTLEKSTDGGSSFQTVIANGTVPPPNVGPRSIKSPVGLNSNYRLLERNAIARASTGETVFVGPRDDPFFVDLGAIFDLGNLRDGFDFGGDASNPSNARDAVAGYNTQSIVMRVPVSRLQKDGQRASQATSILDPDYVIGVWASASRQQITTLSTDGSAPTGSGPWIQVSRLGNPLVNEAIVPIGMKDKWNYTTPYDADEQDFIQYFENPELGLYTRNGAIPVDPISDVFAIPTNSYPAIGDPDNDGQDGFNFNNGEDGVFDVVEGIVNGNLPASVIAGTAFEVPLRPLGDGSPTALAGDNQPRRVDLFPIFYFGVPNARPYQLATGKTGGPLSAGKPFIHNFLPITQTSDGGLWGGDMLRLNMATPTTDRSSSEFQNHAYKGLVRAAALGLTAAPYNTNTNVEFIPHMDGWPNGRRLEDDVTTVALQGVGSLVLAAVGLPYDDATAGDYSDLLSENLVSALTFVAGPTTNDIPLLSQFPYVARPHRGYDYVRDMTADAPTGLNSGVTASNKGLVVPEAFILDDAFPNPAATQSSIRYHLRTDAPVRLEVFDVQGRKVQTLVDAATPAGTHTADWNARDLAAGTYMVRLTVDGNVIATKRATVAR